MKITILSDNECRNGRYLTEHGFSCWIEAKASDGEPVNLLFDMGGSGQFLTNAARLGIDMRTAHYAVLSHGHYDHGGGIAPLLKEAPHIGIYLSSKAFEPHLKGEEGEKYFYSEKNIGLDSSLLKEHKSSFRFMDGETALEEGMILLPAAPARYALPPGRTLCRVDKKKKLTPDDFAHEIYLLVKEGDEVYLFTGCAHRGIANIAAMAKERFPEACRYTLIGGFHIKGDGENTQIGLLEEITRSEPDRWRFISGHCSGKEKVELLSSRLASSVAYGYAGSVHDLT